MAYVSLYRKWRPQVFEEVVGQEYVTRTLANAIRSGNFAHAYLFAGPRGTGKTSTARILAKALNCEEGPTPNPCNRCPSCRSITEGNSVDVVEIDAASNRGIDDIRDLRERVIFTPASSRVKVFILDEAHMITKEAFNAFLKTLEEPPAHVVFVLATTEPHKLPQTILSRCQRYDFRSVPAPMLAEYLQKVAGEEGYQITGEALRLLARRARGSVRDALVALEQLASYGEGVVDESDAAGFLGLIEDEMLVGVGDALISGDIAEVIFRVEKAHDQGRDLMHFASQIQEHFRRVLLLQHADLDPAELEVDEASYEELRRQASLLPPGRTLHFISSLGRVQEEMKQSSAPRLVLESALVAMARGDLEATPEALLARVERVEDELKKIFRRERGEAAHAEAAPAPKVGETAGSIGRALRRPEATGSPEKGREEGASETEARIVKEAVPTGTGAEERERESGTPETFLPGLDLAAVRRSWPHIKERVREKKVTTHAFLLEGKPHQLVGNELVISFPPDRSFHRGELEKENHKRVLEETLEEVLGVHLRVSTRLEENGGDMRMWGETARSTPREGRLPRRKGTADVAIDMKDDGAGRVAEAGTAGRRTTGGGGEEVPEPPAERPEKGDAEARETGKIKLVKDIFGAEMVEEIKLQE